MPTHSEQLERDSETTRAQLQDTLDALHDQITPGEILDQVLAFVGEGEVAAFLDNLRRQVVRRPLAVVLVGAGVGWLMLPARERREASRTLANGGSEPGPFSRVRAQTRAALSDAQRHGEAVRGRGAHLASVDPDLNVGRHPEAEMAGAAHPAAQGLLARAGRFCREQPLFVAGAGLALGMLLGVAAARTLSSRAPSSGSGEEASDLASGGGAFRGPALPITETIGIVPDTPEERS